MKLILKSETIPAKLLDKTKKFVKVGVEKVESLIKIDEFIDNEW